MAALASAATGAETPGVKDLYVLGLVLLRAVGMVATAVKDLNELDLVLLCAVGMVATAVVEDLSVLYLVLLRAVGMVAAAGALRITSSGIAAVLLTQGSAAQLPSQLAKRETEHRSNQ